ncbi:MAG TPA: gliding motility lipoprotein GldH [Lacibacter sp.]|nr:gliding motility lipoprotein GldH [Lacibacter sp.]HMO88609.1 gliding motility lipoprotein GldH [Lacibacter sp.]HMP85961.1 gliding motility lipoprotein GldH [Lacibacter sp.]
MKALFAAFVPVLLLTSCMQLDAFEDHVPINDHRWDSAFQPEFRFTIQDTVSTYDVSVVLRHTDAYAYKNIWLFVSTLQPGDSSYRKERFELILQHPDGRWIGTGLGDVHELRHPLFRNIRLSKPGTYTIRLQQNMRDNPLEHVMDAGIRIEKAQ